MICHFSVTVNTSTLCQKYNEMCVPLQDIKEGCQCVLTSAQHVDEEKEQLSRLLKPSQLNNIRYDFLSRRSVAALNNFFAASTAVHELNRNIFKDIKYEVIGF